MEEVVGGRHYEWNNEKSWYLPFVINGHKYRNVKLINYYGRVRNSFFHTRGAQLANSRRGHRMYERIGKTSKANDFLGRAFENSCDRAVAATMAEIKRRIDKLKAKQTVTEA